MLSLAPQSYQHDGHASGQQYATYYDWVKKEYRGKRDLMERMIIGAGMRPIVPQGGFFMLADTSTIDVPASYLEQSTAACPEMTRDWAFCRWMTEEHGIATIPPSAFYSDKNTRSLAANWVRFAFCKTDEALLEAERRLLKFNAAHRAGGSEGGAR